MNRELVIWAAGLLEGEGSFGCAGVTRVPCVQCHSTDKDVLDRLAATFGGNVTGPYVNQNEKYKPVWYWGRKGVFGYAIMVAVFPWMGERRQGDIQAVIGSWLRYKRKQRDYSTQVRDGGPSVMADTGKKLLVSKGFGAPPVAPPKPRKPSALTQAKDRERKRLKIKKWCVVGMDISASRLAMVALTEPISFEKVDFRTPWVPEVCAHAEAVAMEFVAKLQVKYDWNGDVWIEAPLVGRGGVRPTIVQSFVSGAVQSGLIKIGASVTLITVGEWKAEAIGNGNADKAFVARRLRSRWPDESALVADDGDLLDALGVAHAGAARRGLVARSSPVPKVRRSVLRPSV